MNQQEVGGLMSQVSDDASSEINEKLSYVQHRTRETADLLRRMEQEQEAFAIKCHDRQKLEGKTVL